MGENIVRREHPDEPSKHSRLWVAEEIEHVLANDLQLESLEVLYLDGWKSNNSLLELEFTDIEELPDGIGKLKCLEKLDLSYASFKHLPVSICKLKHLKTLILQWCMLLEKLPDYVGQLKSLEKLDLKHLYVERTENIGPLALFLSREAS
ncbi:hypothetical protein E3N88_19320 [Mikania micrantha]|uniref:Disease resistance R13L4/SHOC-2-like LRR domain-containing protein n=1 Tax=Mikania micrantha TaxID=192012 RepID=A0A5N6NND1_9ASTR|nr:hypothetical protein E3N88_19320 [Mikania micrantha]